MGLEFAYIEGQTPIDEDEKEGLLIPSITIRAELDECKKEVIFDLLLFFRPSKNLIGID